MGRSLHCHVVARQIVGPDSGRNDFSQHVSLREPSETPAILSRDTLRKLHASGICPDSKQYLLFTTNSSDCSTYQLHYPRRSCNSDYTGFAVSGKPMEPLAVLPTINLFGGNGYYVTETMESFADVPQKRVQQYPHIMATTYNPSVFPANSSCPSKPDCPDHKNVLACTQPTQARGTCYGSCTINT